MKEYRPNMQTTTVRRRISRWKIAAYAFLSVGTIVLISGLAFYFYTDSFINLFLKGRITGAIEEAYPAYSVRIGGLHYNIAENRIAFESVALAMKDSSLTVNIAEYTLSGIGWWDILWARGYVPNSLTGTILDAEGIVVRFPHDQYEVLCGRLHVSVPDSEIVVDSLKLHPLGGDNEFFAGGKFRRTRFRLVVPQVRVMGLACLDLLKGKTYRTRSVYIRNVFMDVLINRDKSVAKAASNPLMPNELLASLEQTIAIDSLNIGNGGVKYGERFAPGSKPAIVTLDSVNVSVIGIDNRGDGNDAIVVRAKGKFMKAAEIIVLMAIPPSSPVFSLHYSGALGRMKLRALNPFVEVSEGKRFKSGTLHTLSFDINVNDGCAVGSVRAVYNDFTLAVINKRTGSESGFFDIITSFVANNTKLRRDNIPGTSMKIGVVNYARHRDDPFLRFVWFAVRSGVGDVVGF